eukprot:TRINITY_DN7030_c0_g1_i2.p2 TRINITY_DN7030_c0_g1~~TRINITY_DN7030_c0_g1_i2.p2  ORF type:complete len:289 (+),score=75.35 TRINITY_DN7030_c0_g1_i2:80-868(+)
MASAVAAAAVDNTADERLTGAREDAAAAAAAAEAAEAAEAAGGLGAADVEAGLADNVDAAAAGDGRVAAGAAAGVKRQSTQEIQRNTRKVARIIVCSGLLSAILYFIMSSLFFWYAKLVPFACNRNFDNVFDMLGLWHAILGIVCAIGVFAARELVDAVGHAKVAQKYEAEGRGEEATEEQNLAESDVRCATRCSVLPACLYILAQMGMLVVWIWGIVMTFGANQACRGHVIFFWVLLICSCCSFGCSLSSSGGASYSYRGI